MQVGPGDIQWQLRLLDHFALHGPEGDAALTSRKTIALLVYLALQRDRAARRDVVASLLWEDVDPAQARNNLRQSLAVLRKLDAKGSLIHDSTVDTIRLSRALAVDTEQFDALADADPAQALTLYTTDLMAGFALTNAPSFNEWLAVAQAHWRQRMIGAALRVVDLALVADGDLNAGATAALRLLAVDPYNEAGHRALMQIYSRQGRSALAVSQYRSLADLLRNELDVAPEAETTRLYDDLRAARRAPRVDPSTRSTAPATIRATDSWTAVDGPDRVRRIAVVDDEANLRDAVATYLRIHGFDVVECANAAALDVAVEQAKIDLIVLDVNMPGEDGFSIARRVVDIPIIMLTARNDLIDRVVGLELGADDYLGKPFELRELLARVRATLRRLAP